MDDRAKHFKVFSEPSRLVGVVHRLPQDSLGFDEVVDKGVFKLIGQAEELLLDNRVQKPEALAAFPHDR